MNFNSRKWLMLLVPVALLYIAVEAQDKDDFWIYLSGSRDLFLGKNIYTEVYNEWYHYLYSVWFAILLYPLTLLPFYLSKLLWLGAGAYFTYGIFRNLFSYFPPGEWPEKKRNAFVAAVLFFCVRFITDNFHCGQITLFLIWICLEGTRLVFEGKRFAGAFLIALGINIKILPIVVLPYLFVRRQALAGWLVVLMCAGMLLLPSFVVGHDRNMFLLGEWWNMMNPSNAEHVVDTYDRGFHGLSTFFAVYLHDVTPDPNGYGTRINVTDLSIGSLNLVLNITRLALVACTLYFLRGPLFSNPTARQRIFELSWILALVPLIFPHQQFYAFAFQLPAVSCILYHCFSTGATMRLVVPVVFVFLAFNLQLLLGEFTKFYEHFKIVTFGGLICLVLLWISRRSFAAI